MKEIPKTKSVYQRIFHEVGKGFLWSLGGSIVIIPAVFMLTVSMSDYLNNFMKVATTTARSFPVTVNELRIEENEVQVILELLNDSEFEYRYLSFELEFYSENDGFLYQRFVDTRDFISPNEKELISLSFHREDVPQLEEGCKVLVEVIDAIGEKPSEDI
jgi:hypothetical protein